LQTIQDTYKATFREKGSKFIGFLFPAASPEVFDQRLAGIKSDYPDATHHCYGWRIGPSDPEEFAQDDGEPSGTAGLPILNQLKSAEVINCGCVVVRYYGGTNLGKPGLIQAYGDAAKRCLSRAVLMQLIPTHNFRICYGYSQQKQIDQLKNGFDLKELEAEYLENITLDVACRAEQAPAFAKALQNLAHLDIEAEELFTDVLVMK